MEQISEGINKQLSEGLNKIEEGMKDPKINEALDVINRSVREKKDELKKLISDRYTDIRDTLATEATGAVRRSPWLFLSGVAAGFLIIGYLLGTVRK